MATFLQSESFRRLIIIIGAPILILNWPAIHDYYVVGHVVSNEKYIRAAELGIRDTVGHLLFYPESIIRDHLGQTFLFGSAITIAGGVAARCFGRSGNLGMKPATYRDETFLLQVIFLLGAILGPIIVLTADIAKSVVVGGIVGVPAALLIVTLAARVTRKLRGPEFSRGSKLLVAASLAVFALGLFNLFNRTSRHLPEYAQRRDLNRLVELENWLINYASERGWRDPYISYDVISDRLNSGVLNVSALEQSREPIVFHTLLGGAMTGVGESEALSLLKASDFVILTTLQKTGLFPFYRDVARYWDHLKAWADEEMILVRTVPFDSFTATVYARPSAILSGLSRRMAYSRRIVNRSATCRSSSVPQDPALRNNGLFAAAEDTRRFGNGRHRRRPAVRTGIVPSHRYRLRNPDRHLGDGITAIRHYNSAPSLRHVFCPQECG